MQDVVPWFKARFDYCPIASAFIDDADGAASYYAHKFIGDHEVDVRGVKLTIRFNHEEIHLFTERHEPPTPYCATHAQVSRRGGRGEVRCFDLHRARAMDSVIPTLRNPAAAIEAKGYAEGVQIFGPADTKGLCMSVILAPDTGDRVWFVRTSWRTNTRELRRVCANSRRAPWPPKSLEPRSP